MSVIETLAEPEQRLKDLGINLPQPPKPLGAYVEAVQAGNLLFLSGWYARSNGRAPADAGV
jgi:enamine deaminase RidA (YjgF/YER057c/UK114 family)